MIIGFSGCDGSGKTTIATLLLKRLREMGFKAEYHHFNDKFLLKIIFGLLSERTKSDLNENFFKRRHRYFKLWPYIQLLDSFAYFLYCRILRRNIIIVWDRYPPDALPIWEYYSYSDRVIRLLYSSFPRPDILFLLDVPPTVAHKRGESTHVYKLNFYHFQRERLFDITKKFRAKITNSDKSVYETFNEVFKKVKKLLGTDISHSKRVYA